MYTHCYHCAAALGANGRVAHFPAGRRLAYDPERGRLWAVCPVCARWNLAPLEERWEALDECEHLFRSARRRAQTANVAHVRVGPSLELTRVGRPPLPEFAAWRYGRVLARRRQAVVWSAGALGAAALGLAAGGPLVGLGGPALVGALFLARAAVESAEAPESVRLRLGPGRSWTVSGDDTMILPDAAAGWRLAVRHGGGAAEYRGEAARLLLRRLLARFNRAGGPQSLVDAAVGELESRPGHALFRHAADQSEGFASVDRAKQVAFDGASVRLRGAERPKNRGGLAHMPAARRLALEMALHEESERRALAGELAELERAWRTAEDIARIADEMLLPPAVREFVDRHKRA